VRILTHNAHTALCADMARMGHQWFSYVPAGRRWDHDIRPMPGNWRDVESMDGEFDAIVAFTPEGCRALAGVRAPMVFDQINDSSEGALPAWLETRCHAVNFISSEVADRWEMKDRSKVRVIPMGVDASRFLPWTGEGMGNDVMTAGTAIPDRWDKGHDALVVYHRTFRKVDLYGPGNFKIRPGRGVLNERELVEAYSRYKVYFNPGPVVGLSVAEAMLAGLPIVTFRPINQRDLIVDEVSGFVVDTLDGAEMRIARLLSDPALRQRVGAAGREAASRRFSLAAAAESWGALLSEAAAARGRAPAEAVRS